MIFNILYKSIIIEKKIDNNILKFLNLIKIIKI